MPESADKAEREIPRKDIGMKTLASSKAAIKYNNKLAVGTSFKLWQLKAAARVLVTEVILSGGDLTRRRISEYARIINFKE